MAQQRSCMKNWVRILVVIIVSGVLLETGASLLSKVSACSARVDKGLINLMPLGQGKLPVLNTQFKGWNYSYKPCLGFNKPDNPYAGFGDTCLSVAICKYTEQQTRHYYYTLGFNQNASFLMDKYSPDDDDDDDDPNKEDSVKIMFEGFRSMKSKRTYIRLICDKNRKTPQQALFRIIKDLPRRGNVEAELHHLCCCPDGCPVQPKTTAAEPVVRPEPVVPVVRHFNSTDNETEVVKVPAKKDDKIETDRTKVMVIVGVNLGIIFLAGAVGLLCYNKRSHLEIYHKLPGIRATPDPNVWQMGNPADVERAPSGLTLHSTVRPPLDSQSSVDSKSGYRDGEPYKRRKSLCFPVLEHCHIPENTINMGQRLGGGIFGDTYVGDWTGFSVAVKRITLSVHKYQTDPENIKAIEEEVLYLSQQRHRNIVSVLGFCSESKHPYIISEFIKGQVVKDLVKNSGESLSWYQRVKMLAQVADGMAFLHSNKPLILHRDLRCANLFITNNEVMKICDFGIVKLTQPLRAKCKEEECCCQGLYSACPPSVGWTAPEVLEHPNALESDGHFTVFCDVYSYAIVMWELVTGDDPFEEFNTVQEVIEHVIGSGRPELPDPSLMLPVYIELMQKLWVPTPEERLTFKQITVQLKDISHQAKVFQKMLNSKQTASKTNNTRTVSFTEGTKEGT